MIASEKENETKSTYTKFAMIFENVMLQAWFGKHQFGKHGKWHVESADTSMQLISNLHTGNLWVCHK